MAKKQQQKKRKRKPQQKQSQKPPRIPVQEFVSQIINDKTFRKSLTVVCYQHEADPADPDALAKWLNQGAHDMGQRYTDQEFVNEFNTQIREIGAFKRMRVLGTLTGTFSAVNKEQAKKASKQQNEDEE